MAVHPSSDREAQACKQWLADLLLKGEEEFVVCVPEVADYELRRKLLHLALGNPNYRKSIERLDELNAKVVYIPITTAAMQKAAELWADARKKGTPTADEKELDVDVILAAQTLIELLSNAEDSAIVATTNVGHLEMFVAARRWQEIS